MELNLKAVAANISHVGILSYTRANQQVAEFIDKWLLTASFI